MTNNNSFYHSDILRGSQFTRDQIDVVMATARKMKKIVETAGGSQELRGKIMTALFYEPSSRTFGSFVAAMQRLGGGFIPLQGMANSSVVKGETLEDTVHTFSAYSDVIVIRHPEVGAADKAASVTDIPVINAGDGIGEHPTQGLIDLFTIQERFQSIDRLHILIIGDLAHYRPTNSLLELLANYPGVTMDLATPPEVPIQESVRSYLKKKNMTVREHHDFSDLLPTADVLYVTRVKKEYMSEELYHKIRSSYIVDKAIVGKMKKESIVMHCLPRIDEITVDVDGDPRAVYFSDQVRNGLYVRMALLSLVLSNNQ